ASTVRPDRKCGTQHPARSQHPCVRLLAAARFPDSRTAWIGVPLGGIQPVQHHPVLLAVARLLVGGGGNHHHARQPSARDAVRPAAEVLNHFAFRDWTDSSNRSIALVSSVRACADRKKMSVWSMYPVNSSAPGPSAVIGSELPS